VVAATGTARLRRLEEELAESGLVLDGPAALQQLVLEEIDHALRPTVHERRVASSGSFVEPQSDPATWSSGSQLDITRGSTGDLPLEAARRFADGLSSWLVRRTDGGDEWMVFDRSAGSERDLVVLAEVLQATVVQRHPSGSVRVVGGSGVFRWDGFRWHHEPPLESWIDVVAAERTATDREVLTALLRFAIHDLGSLRVGALLIHRPDATSTPPGAPGPSVESRLPTPPPLQIRRPFHLAPLRHALAQVDGAALFDGDGVLRELGVRLIPSPDAEDLIAGLRGTRHTSGVRYSHDDPQATVIAVSDDGPVSVFRAGAVLGDSHERRRA